MNPAGMADPPICHLNVLAVLSNTPIKASLTGYDDVFMDTEQFEPMLLKKHVTGQDGCGRISYPKPARNLDSDRPSTKRGQCQPDAGERPPAESKRRKK